LSYVTIEFIRFLRDILNKRK